MMPNLLLSEDNGSVGASYYRLVPDGVILWGQVWGN